MGNRYLEKIARLKNPFGGSRNRDYLDAIGFGMSGLGLSLSANNYMNNRKSLESSLSKAKTEEHSLRALREINKTLKQIPVNPGTK